MNWDVPIFGIRGFQTLLDRMNVEDGKIEFRYPGGPCWSEIELRHEAPHSRRFFKIVIDEVSKIAPEQKKDYQAILDCGVTDNIAVFMTLKSSGETISYLRIIGVVSAKSDLEKFYIEDDYEDTGIYYRLDYSEEERGNLFDHPFPHLHTTIDGAPRLQLPYHVDIFPPLSFFEFLARNHHYEKWKKWALAIYDSHYGAKSVDINSLTPVEMLDRFKTKADWERVGVEERSAFIRNFRQAIHTKMVSLSEGFPKVDPEYVAYNFYQVNTAHS